MELVLKLDGATAVISKVNSSYVLSWGDHVANDWEEVCATLSDALLRLACLAKCGESNWVKFFGVSDEDFPAVAEKFFSEVLC